MFKIDLQIKETETITGLQALDKRRELGLPDDSTLCISESRCRWVEVPEAFARQHFAPSDVEVTRQISIDKLRSGDVETGRFGAVQISDSLSDERIMELWAIAEPVED